LEHITPEDSERLRDALDAKALEGMTSPKTMFNAWTVFTTAAKTAAGQWKKDKPKKLRVRTDNPCLGFVPHIDDATELQKRIYLDTGRSPFAPGRTRTTCPFST